MTLDRQLAHIRADPELQDVYEYIKELWNYGYGAGIFDGTMLCLPEFDDDDNLIDWRGRVL